MNSSNAVVREKTPLNQRVMLLFTPSTVFLAMHPVSDMGKRLHHPFENDEAKCHDQLCRNRLNSKTCERELTQSLLKDSNGSRVPLSYRTITETDKITKI